MFALCFSTCVDVFRHAFLFLEMRRSVSAYFSVCANVFPEGAYVFRDAFVVVVVCCVAIVLCICLIQRKPCAISVWFGWIASPDGISVNPEVSYRRHCFEVRCGMRAEKVSALV